MSSHPTQHCDTKSTNANLENLESCNIQNANEWRALAFSAINRSIDSLDNPLKHSLVDGFADRFHSKFNLIHKQHHKYYCITVSCLIYFITIYQEKQRQCFKPTINCVKVKSNYFIVRPKVDQRAGLLSLPHLGILAIHTRYTIIISPLKNHHRLNTLSTKADIFLDSWCTSGHMAEDKIQQQINTEAATCAHAQCTHTITHI